ncbi:nucleotidyltransferase domain-containing protein [Streptacidiphilus melanogenes]|uniref:nucleotidyltransferase domain-containing protein n=1 Tax=Streptacidiphilus melanogenes TaxID=411235 RepID=UPI0005AB8894|nr:nucleotidyltransferase domain-containing protein [Streptacidiphilus melanogenes]
MTGNGARGLAADGTIAREGSPDRVAPEFAPVVEATRSRIVAAFGDPSAGSSRLHSAYLYGSVPRGTAVPGRSDLDLLLALRGSSGPGDRATADALGRALDADFPQIDGVGVLVFDTATLLSELERYDLGFFVACLCTPLLGEDLAARLPRYRPTSLLARETNGDLARLLPLWRDRRAAATTDAELLRLSRHVGRHLTRTGFTLVMPRWGGWTSDLTEAADLFGRYYPSRADQMRLAARTGRTPTTAAPTLSLLVDELGPWLAAEYARVHGVKTPRP